MWVTLQNLKARSHQLVFMINREWVTMHHCCSRQSHFILAYDQQPVSNITHLSVEWQFHYIFCYNLQFVSDIAQSCERSSHFLLWPTACEWHCPFCESSLITSFPITNSKWVTLHILLKAVFSDLFLSPTVCEWHCKFCERQPHWHIFFYDQQEVSDIAHSKSTSFLMTNREWVQLDFCERQSHRVLFNDQQEVSNIKHFVKGSLIHIMYIFLWPKEVSDSAYFCEWSLIVFFSYGQQVVSDIAFFCKRHSHHVISMTTSL